MKLSMAFPATGCQKLTKVDGGRKRRMFYEKHVAKEVAADALAEEQQKGYVVRISGGNNKRSRVTSHVAMSACCSVRGIPVNE